MRSKILAALLAIPLFAAGTAWAVAATLPQMASAQGASGEHQIVRISDSRFVVHDGERLVLYVVSGETNNTFVRTCEVNPNTRAQYACK